MKSYTKDTLRIYWQHVTRYRATLIVTMCGILLGVGSGLYLPLLYKELLDQIAGKGAAYGPFSTLIKILATLIVGWTGWRVATFADSFFVSRLMADLYNTCFHYIHGHSYSFFNNNFIGSLVRRINRYAKSFENISDQIKWNLIPTTVTLGVILVILFIRHWLLGLTLLIWLVFYLSFLSLFIRYKSKFDQERVDSDTKVSGYLADTLTNNLNVKLFTGFSFEFKAFKKLTDHMFRSRWSVWQIESVGEAVQAGFMTVFEFGILWAAVSIWREGNLTVGDFALIQGYVIQIFNHMWNVGRNMQKIFENITDANETTELLVTPQEVVDAPEAKKLIVAKGAVRFDNVVFGYHKKRRIYNGFNLDIAPGERVALIGSSGGGKSTIVKLILRYLDIQGGAITVDGQNIAEVTQDSLRGQIALVPQDPILFHRTLMENIRYARPTATDAEVMQAAKLAHCHEFINQLPEKYDTFVGERGVKLSGGERQRVAIARAILKDAPILLLDEATSSLDSESERYIQDALQKLMAGRTTVVIAHRLSTIMQMDRIVVISKGKIIEQGTHDELLKVTEGTYQKLWEIQAGSFSSGE